jgi:G3E family GTPase
VIGNDQPRRTPVTVLGGYLGAGKTTLLNAVLGGTHGERIAVIVNDFGAVNIDASLISTSAADRIDLANGCACCQLGDSIADAFTRLAETEPPFDRIIIEASGVALPQALAGWATLPRLRLDGVVVVVDPVAIGDQVNDRFVGQTVRAQISDADLVVVTKADLVDHRVLAQAVGIVRQIDSESIIVTSGLTSSLPLIFGVSIREHDRRVVDTQHTNHLTVVWSTTVAVPVNELLYTLTNTPGLIRAKGYLLTQSGHGVAAQLVQLVGRRVSIEATQTAVAETQLVLIGPSDRFEPRDALERLNRLVR